MMMRFKFVALALSALMLGCQPVSAQPDSAAAETTPEENPAVSDETKPGNVYVAIIGEDGKLTKPVVVPKVIRTDEEWQKLLTPEQYRILRNKGTEPAFCGGLLKNKEKGIYACVGCNLPLFKSDAKFESGTGWPSFFQPVAPTNILEKSDMSHGMVRTEILCPRCESHMGHVFPDGPEPTGLRYCLNSECLKFVAEPLLGTLAEPVPDTPAAELIIAGGCFWCVEAVFEEIDGVLDAESGYSGGEARTANYKAVCNGDTGHAEAVRIIYDPSKVTADRLLELHFATHDPTTLNQQGADRGTQYRSAIFYKNDQEKKAAEDFIAKATATGKFKDPIVTTVEPLKEFYPAEIYHQNYVCRNPMQGYVRAVAMPKVEKIRKLLKEEQ